jgi:hypothetical protein
MAGRRRTSRALRRNVVIVPKRKPPKLGRGNAYVYFPFAEAPMGAISPEFRAALNDPRTRLRYDSRDEAEAAARELDRDYPNQRWHVTDAQRPRRNPAPPLTWSMDHDQRLAWVQRTFAPGTSVKFAGTERWPIGAVARLPVPLLDHVYVPYDTRGTVVRIVDIARSHDVLIQVRLHDARAYFAGTQRETELLHQMWDTLEQAGTDIVTIDSINPKSILSIIPLDDNWAADQQQSFAASKRRSSYKTRPNRMKRNPAPPTPPYGTRHWEDWWRRTFTPGTPVAITNDDGSPGPRAEVVRVDKDSQGRLILYAKMIDFRDENGFPIKTSLVGKVLDFVLDDDAHEHFIPLVDNWAISSKPVQRYSLPASQRRSSYKTRPNRLKPNTIPPPPSSWTHLPSWIKRTFADGTSVKLLHPVEGYSPRAHNLVVVPAGTKGRVAYVGDDVDEYGHKTHDMFDPEISITLYPSYASYDDVLVHVPWAEAHYVLEPLDDNWAAVQQTAAQSVKKRYQLPASQRRSSYKSRPNRRTSRRR